MAELKEGLVTGAMNLFFIYKFLRILTTPWKESDAFKLGIVDEDGKILKKKSQLKTIEEKDAYTMMHRLVWKIKRLMEKVPFGKTRLASYAAALWLIKEGHSFKGDEEQLQESMLNFMENDDWNEEAIYIKEEHDKYMNKKSFNTFLSERSLTPDEKKKKEEIVKKLKNKLDSFKARYGDDAKSVMYGVATKQAKGEEIEETETEASSYFKGKKKKGFQFGISRKGGSGAGKGYGSKKKAPILMGDEVKEEVSEKDFDSLKKGDNITIEFKSSMSSGKSTFRVTAKNIVGKAKVHKVTLQSVKKPGGVKFFLYKRGNKVSLAQGDMAASVVKYTIEGADYMADPNGIDDTIGKEKKLYPSGEEIKHNCDEVHPDLTHDEWEGLADEEEPNEDFDPELDEFKMTLQQKLKRKKWLRTSGGRRSLRKKKKYAAKIKSGSRRVNKQLSRQMKKSRRKAGYRRDDLQHTEETMKAPSFKEFIAEGRAKLSPEDEFDRLGIQPGDRAIQKILDAQKKAYSLSDVKTLARKHKVNLDGEPLGGTKEWDYEWQIAIRGGITLQYTPRDNSFEIRGMRLDKKKLRSWQKKYAPAHARLDDNLMGKVVIGSGFETALELIGEEVVLEEGTSLQVKMALSDVGLKGTWKNNKVYVKKKDVKKAEKALKGNVIYKGKTPEVVGEEAPANNVGDGNIDLTPHKKKKKVKTEEFSGSKVFIVSPETFWQARLGKSRYTRYEKYVGNDDIGEAIREYGRSNPKAPIILKNSQNGSMLYLKYGKRG